MGTLGTFGSFTQARLGIYAAQQGLSVTGNNIANINTQGYTRQKLEQTSMYAGTADRYYSANDMNIGYGVQCTGVSQLRDPYLDIRYRSKIADMGAMNAKLGALQNVEAILDEVGKGEDGFGVIEQQFNDLLNSLQQLSEKAGQSDYEIQVRSSAEALVKKFNSYASQLEEVQRNAQADLKQNVTQVNKILESIRDLNSAIRKSEIHGDKALELRDRRNMLIDDLSEYVRIDVTYEPEDIGAGQTVEKLVIRLGDANPDASVKSDSAVLIDGVFGANLDFNPELNQGADKDKLPYLDKDGRPTADFGEAQKSFDPDYNMTVSKLVSSDGTVYKTKGGKESEDIPLNDNDLYGVLQAQREFLTEAGEFTSDNTINNTDRNARSKRGLPYYMKSLDLLANQFATIFNDLNTGKMVNQEGKPVSPEQVKDTPLFSNKGDGDDTAGITAKNISISKSWSKGPCIVNSFVIPDGFGKPASTDNSNILKMIGAFSNDYDFKPNQIDNNAPGESMFNGSFQDMWVNIGATLGNDMMVTETMLDTYESSATDLNQQRMGVSSVDLNDEAMNLMQYSKSYNAACRLMTTLDSVLDRLINGTAM